MMVTYTGPNTDDSRVVKELKDKLKDKDHEISALRAEVSKLEMKADMIGERRALEVELLMRAKVEEAYEKGFNSCKEQFIALKQLQAVL